MTRLFAALVSVILFLLCSEWAHAHEVQIESDFDDIEGSSTEFEEAVLPDPPAMSDEQLCEACVATVEYTMRVMLTMARTHIDYTKGQRIDVSHPEFMRQVCRVYPMGMFTQGIQDACEYFFQVAKDEVRNGYIGEMAMSATLHEAFDGEEAKMRLLSYTKHFCGNFGACPAGSIGALPFSGRDECSMCKVVADDLRVRMSRYYYPKQEDVATELADTCKLLGIRHEKASRLGDMCWEMSEEQVLTLEQMLIAPSKWDLHDRDAFINQVCGDNMMGYC